MWKKILFSAVMFGAPLLAAAPAEADHGKSLRYRPSYRAVPHRYVPSYRAGVYQRYVPSYRGPVVPPVSALRYGVPRYGVPHYGVPRYGVPHVPRGVRSGFSPYRFGPRGTAIGVGPRGFSLYIGR